MTDEQNRPDEPPSLADLVGNVLSTVAEIGWSLVAAGRGVFSVASRLLRLAQEQIRPPSGDRGLEAYPPGGIAARGLQSAGESSPRPKRSSSAAALEGEVLPARTSGAEDDRGATGSQATADVGSATPGLPDLYGRDRLVAVARDPESLFVWWEVTESTRRAAHRQARLPADEKDGAPPPGDALRIAIVDGDAPPRGGAGSWLIALPPFATSRYVQVPRSQRRFEVTLGVLTDGLFTPLLAPAMVETPESEVASDIEVRWRTSGDPTGAVEQAPAPPTAAIESLWQLLGSAPLPGSQEWPAGHRLLELEIGGSHELPTS